MQSSYGSLIQRVTFYYHILQPGVCGLVLWSGSDQDPEKKKRQKKDISRHHDQIMKQAGSPVFAISGCPQQRRMQNRTRQTGGTRRGDAGTGTYGGDLPAGDQRSCRRTGKNTDGPAGMERILHSGRLPVQSCETGERGGPRGMPRFVCHGRNCPQGQRDLRHISRKCSGTTRKAAGPAIRLPYFSTFMVYYRGLS